VVWAKFGRCWLRRAAAAGRLTVTQLGISTLATFKFHNITFASLASANQIANHGKMGSTASSAKPSPQIAELVKKLITENDVMVFSKTYCPYCVRAKSAVNAITKAAVMELDEVDNGSAIQAHLRALTNQSTVPNIFVHGMHVGGCDDTLAAIKSGNFQKALNGDLVFPQVKL